MPLTTAYAGHGNTTEANVKAMLDQFLPPALGLVFIPERVPRMQAGLKTTITWLEGEVGKNGTIPVPDLVEALLNRNDPKVIEEDKDREGPDDLALVMLFDGENEEDVALAKRAFEAGIRVVDLAAAGDDLLLDDADITFEEVPAEEEPPFEPDEPRAPTLDETLAKADEHPVTTAISNATEAAMAAVAQHQAPLPGSVTIDIRVTLPPEGVRDIAAIFAPAIVAAMGAQAQATVKAVAAPADEPGGATVSHIKGGAAGEQPAGTKPYYYDSEKGTYRPARGMARKSEQKVFLTDADQAQIKTDGLLA